MTTQKKSFDSGPVTAISVFVLTLLALTCIGCAGPAAQTSWQSPLHQDHSLVGEIWHSERNRFMSRDELLTLQQQHALLLLGEKHDNPDHHRLRLQLLDDLLPSAGSTLLVLEMLERFQQDNIDEIADSDLPADDARLAARLEWDNEGWPWEFYGPVLGLALQRGASLRAGNINSDDVMQIYSDTVDHNTQMLNTRQLAQLARDIDSSHCGMLPSDQFPAMVRVQQARDKQMADALMSAADGFDKGILLAGNYHIRHDLGVSNYLDKNSVGRPLSIAFLEVDPEQENPEAYQQQFSEQRAYDVIWFTPALRQDDYCADMRASQAP